MLVLYKGWHNAVNNKVCSGAQVVFMLYWWILIQLCVVPRDDAWVMEIRLFWYPCGTKLVVLGVVVLVCGWFLVSGTFAAVQGILAFLVLWATHKECQWLLIQWWPLESHAELWHLAIVWWQLGGNQWLRLQEVGYDVETRLYWWFVLCWCVAWQLIASIMF